MSTDGLWDKDLIDAHSRYLEQIADHLEGDAPFPSGYQRKTFARNVRLAGHFFADAVKHQGVKMTRHLDLNGNTIANATGSMLGGPITTVQLDYLP
mgnify:CR=1 FL=1